MPGIGGLYLDVFAPFLPVIYEFLDCITLSHWSEQIREACSLLTIFELLDFFPFPYWSDQIRDSCYWWTVPDCPCSVPPSDP
jgi:hypothetical protein